MSTAGAPIFVYRVSGRRLRAIEGFTQGSTARAGRDLLKERVNINNRRRGPYAAQSSSSRQTPPRAEWQSGVQDLLDNPNPNSPAQAEAYQLFVSDRLAYDEKIKAIAAANAQSIGM